MVPAHANLLPMVFVGLTSVGHGGQAFADTPFEREAQLAILVGSLLAAGVGIAILLTAEASQAPGPK
jgi:hypothetical protein